MYTSRAYVVLARGYNWVTWPLGDSKSPCYWRSAWHGHPKALMHQPPSACVHRGQQTSVSIHLHLWCEFTNATHGLVSTHTEQLEGAVVTMYMYNALVSDNLSFPCFFFLRVEREGDVLMFSLDNPQSVLIWHVFITFIYSTYICIYI